jgi:hypothetical protein
MTEQTITRPTIALELTYTEARYLEWLLDEEGRGLPRRPTVLVQIERKLEAALDATETD